MMLRAMFLVLLTLLSYHVALGRTPGKPVKRHRDTWHEFKLPQVPHDEVIVSLGQAEYYRNTRRAFDEQPVLACDQRCQDTLSKNITQQEAEQSQIFERIDENGLKTVIRVPINNDFVDYINEWSNKAKVVSQKSRRKREVYQYDTRFPINDPTLYETSPFSSAVVLSTGCSGVLIAPQYVLTAAHCIHNGKKYIEKMKKVRAGFRRDRDLEPGDSIEEAFYWIRATDAYLPHEWTTSGKQKYLPVEKDYAVVKLKRESDRPYLNISVGTTENVASGTRIHIPAFDNKDDPTLIYRFCRVTDGTQEVMYQVCDSDHEAIGAGVYVRRWDREARKWQRKVVAIYGGHASFYQGHNTQDYNVALRLTPLKFAQICFWTTGSYGGCEG